MSKILFAVFVLAVICTSFHGALAKPAESDPLQSLEPVKSSQNEAEQAQGNAQNADTMTPEQNETQQAQSTTQDANLINPVQNETQHAQDFELAQFISNDTYQTAHTVQFVEMITALKIEAAQLQVPVQELELKRHQIQIETSESAQNATA